MSWDDAKHTVTIALALRKNLHVLMLLGSVARLTPRLNILNVGRIHCIGALQATYGQFCSGENYMAEDVSSSNTVELATELTIAWLSNPNTRANPTDVPEFLRTMHDAVGALGEAGPSQAPEPEAQEYTPATTARRSLSSPDHIISMIDGKPYKTLRRHLSTNGLTPEQYRERYKLKPDYPMVAPNYSEARRSMAHKIGLGQKGRAARSGASAEKQVKAPGRRGRKPKDAEHA